MAKNDEKSKDEHHHQGSSVPEDESLSKWIIGQWSKGETVERIEVFQVFGKEKRDRGEMIFHEVFGPGRKLDAEQANHLANEIIAAAQNDCDATPKRRESYFQICIVDKHRRAQPLVRRLGPFRPQRNLAIVRAGDSEEGDGDDEDLTIRGLEHARLKTSFDEARWGNTRNDRVLGELLMLMGSMIQEQRNETRELRAENREMYRTMQDAEDRRIQRELALSREKFKLDLMKEGVRSARNLLPGLFAEAKGGSGFDGDEGGKSNGKANNVAKVYGPSPERTLVDNFLSDCEEAGIIDKLFGEGDVKDGKLVITKPGVFTVDQVYIMMGVRQGRLPVKALDPLMPKSGHKVAITEEQIQQAMAAGVTEGIGMALLELVALRKRAQEAADAKNDNNEDK